MNSFNPFGMLMNMMGNNGASANLINQLRPFPTPAYITCSPYTTSNNCGVCV